MTISTEESGDTVVCRVVDSVTVVVEDWVKVVELETVAVTELVVVTPVDALATTMFCEKDVDEPTLAVELVPTVFWSLTVCVVDTE